MELAPLNALVVLQPTQVENCRNNHPPMEPAPTAEVVV
jgi:hypothetical protein